MMFREDKNLLWPPFTTVDEAMTVFEAEVADDVLFSAAYLTLSEIPVL